MADMIIKPSSGNNLVVQGGDSSPAITVANTGTTTFAENATLSGTANNLGTATAGTLSSGVTFPAGHVLQVTHSRNGYAHDLSSTSYQALLSSSGVTWEPQIDTTSASSKVLANISILMKGDTSGQEDARGYIQMDWDIGGAGWNTIDEMDEITGNYDRGGNGIWQRTTVSWTRLLSPGSDAIIKFRFNIKVNSGSSAYHGASGCFSNVTLMELVG